MPVDTDGNWIDNEGAVTSSFQRHLLQVGHVDRLIGDILDALESSGRWDDTVLVVVADHGVTFDPDSHRRRPNPDTVDEVYRIPLFVHTPDGPQGEIRNDRVHNGDLMPTLVDALDIETDWTFSGDSLLEPTDSPARTTVYSRAGPVEIELSLGPLMEVVERNTERLPHGEDWRSVAAPGDAGALVGSPLADLDVGPSVGPITVDNLADLVATDRASGFLPVMVEATFEGEDPPDQLLVVVDGVVAGSGVPQRSDDRYTTILDPSVLSDGEHRVDVLAWSDGRVHAVDSADAPVLGVEDGTVTRSGVALPLLAGIDLEIDKSNRVDGQIAVWGWSVDGDGERLPDAVVLFDDDGVIASDRRFTKSSAAADRHGDSFAFSRFSVRGSDGDRLRIAAIYEDGVVVTDV